MRALRLPQPVCCLPILLCIIGTRELIQLQPIRHSRHPVYTHIPAQRGVVATIANHQLFITEVVSLLQLFHK